MAKYFFFLSKTIKFVFIVLFLGLLQYSVSALALSYLGEPINIPTLLKDGSLYFFSTSLATSSAFILAEMKIENENIKSWDSIFSMIILTVVLSLAVIGYNVELVQSVLEQRTMSFDKGSYPNHQILCLGLSALHAIYSAGRVGLFNQQQTTAHLF